MDGFVRGDCHKCKFEITAECVPRSQKMGFPNCYQTTMTNADYIRAMTDEELALYLDNMQGLAYINGFDNEPIRLYPNNYGAWLDWLRQEVKDGKQNQPAP